MKRTNFPIRILEDEPPISPHKPSFTYNDEYKDIKDRPEDTQAGFGGNKNSQKIQEKNPLGSKLVEAIYAFPGEMEDDLTIKPGDRIRVLEETKNGWWVGYNFTSNKTGLFPSNFVRAVKKANN